MEFKYALTVSDLTTEEGEYESFVEFSEAYANAINTAKAEAQYGSTCLIDAVIFNREVKVEFYRDRNNKVQHIES